MTTLAKVLLATTLAFSAAAPVLAQEAHTLTERNVYLFTADGRMIQAKTSDAAHAMAMSHFKPLAAGTMIYVSGGKVYVGQDEKMSDGRMLSTAIFGKDLGITVQ